MSCQGIEIVVVGQYADAMKNQYGLLAFDSILLS